MSFKVVEWVLDHSESEGSVRLVMLALAENADQDTGECYPSLATVARRTRLSERRARSSIRAAEEAGELSVELRAGIGPHGGHRTNVYTFTRYLAERGDDSSPHFAESGDAGGRVRGRTRSSEGTLAVGKPSVEPSENQNTRESLTLLPVEPEPSTPRASESHETRRARDPVFDALQAAFPGATPAQIGKARKDLRARYDLDADPFPEEITRRRAGLSILFENAPVSIMALVKWWTEAGEKAPPPAPGAEIAAITDAEWARIVDLDWPRIQDCRVCRGPAYAQTSYCEPHLAEAEAFIRRRQGADRARER
jgi:hypothetical protein